MAIWSAYERLPIDAQAPPGRSTTSSEWVAFSAPSNAARPGSASSEIVRPQWRRAFASHYFRSLGTSPAGPASSGGVAAAIDRASGALYAHWSRLAAASGSGTLLTADDIKHGLERVANVDLAGGGGVDALDGTRAALHLSKKKSGRTVDFVEFLMFYSFQWMAMVPTGGDEQSRRARPPGPPGVARILATMRDNDSVERLHNYFDINGTGRITREQLRNGIRQYFRREAWSPTQADIDGIAQRLAGTEDVAVDDFMQLVIR